LRCVACAVDYAIEDGIVDFAPSFEPDSPTDALKLSEMRLRDAEATEYESLFIPLRSEAEIAAARDALSPRREDLVLELGIGPARVARRYGPQVGRILGVDLSWRSLQVARERLMALRVDACLVRADICRLPVRAGVCNKALAAQVLQHLPSAHDLRASLDETARVVERGGLFVATVYHLSLPKRIRGFLRADEVSDREGLHSDGQVYYQNFSRREFRSLLAERFDPIDVRGIVMQMGPGMHRANRLTRTLETALQRTAIARWGSHLLLGVARNR